jgi:aldehyde dehydrogenase (NAD+)
VYVERPVRDEFLRKVREHAERVDVGTEELSAYGPMTVAAQVDLVRRHVSEALEAGAEAVIGGLDSIRAPFIDPIVLADVPEDCSAVQEETFGPVVVVNTVENVDDAVRRANGTVYGLGSSVFSARSGPAIARRLRAGGTSINAVLSFVGMPSVPFGGVGNSGFGRSHGDDGLRELTYPKATVRKRFGMGKDMQAFPRTPDQFDVVRKTIRMRYAHEFRGDRGSTKD